MIEDERIARGKAHKGGQGKHTEDRRKKDTLCEKSQNVRCEEKRTREWGRSTRKKNGEKLKKDKEGSGGAAQERRMGKTEKRTRKRVGENRKKVEKGKNGKKYTRRDGGKWETSTQE